MSSLTSNPCEQIASQIGSMFVCSNFEQHVRIRTPFLYPDGDVVDVFLVQQGDRATLTDLGESLRWLRTQSASMKKSPKQKFMIQDVCMTHGVELRNGMLILQMDHAASMADAIVRIGQAIVRVADLYFTLRNRSVQSVTDEVEDYLKDRELVYQRNVERKGASGKVWTIDFSVQSDDHVALVQVLSTGSRGAARSIVNSVVATWVDIAPDNDRGRRLKRVSLFDDNADVWEPEDYAFVGRMSDGVARWSRPDEFEATVRAA